MSPKKKNGGDILDKILPTLIDVPRNHPDYMGKYMKIKRRKEKIDPLTIKSFELRAQNLFDDLEKTIVFKKIF